ncbi:hypothetical protein Sjap_015001 [Stephania japonica]|uniref:Uncharacterized protein n=1 Tax=Stephania japonica TaxID=461633 RepID=A0AAP0IIA9_9MAGN
MPYTQTQYLIWRQLVVSSTAKRSNSSQRRLQTPKQIAYRREKLPNLHQKNP